MKDDRLYLEHIREAIAKIVSYSAGGWEASSSNAMAQDAVLRNFEILGEAAKRLSAAAKNRRPDVPWREIAGFRDVLIHNYLGVNLKRVWNVIEQNPPDFQRAVDEILKDG